MKTTPKNSVSEFLIVCLGILISVLSFSTTSYYNPDVRLIFKENLKSDAGKENPATPVDVRQIQERQAIQDAGEQPPLNIVASFIMFEAKTRNKPGENADDEKGSEQESIIRHFIRIFF